MAFEIVNETYHSGPDEDPKKWGYIEGYTSNSVGETYLRLNIKSIPDQDQYDCHKRCSRLDEFEYRVGKPYGEGVRLNKKQVCRLIWELLKWLVRGW
ncbi:MAG: hypothetical protein J6B99_09620 [Oscillospiraceae bacterium]|nr:hypothetical protein [Oscillospiraceae bacterium]